MKIFHWVISKHIHVWIAATNEKTAIKKALKREPNGYLFNRDELEKTEPTVISIGDFYIANDEWDS